jgi:hypothetical protein
MARINLVRAGRRVGKLLVLRRAGTNKRGRLWLCICDCGRKKLINTNSLRVVKSCGCMYRGGRFQSLVGKRFGRLFVMRDSGKRQPDSGARLWLCRCDCGRDKLVASCDLTKTNGTQSCGCLFLEHCATIRRTHGARSMDVPPGVKRAYSSWSNMRTRCLNPNSINWKDYGGAGITVHKAWLGPNGFRAFLADMGQRPEGTTLDRRNAFEGYNPENCRWADAETQANNQRRFYVDGKPPELPARSVAQMEAEGW